MAGANIKIGANSSDFQKQMKDVTRELKVMQSEFGLTSEKARLFGSTTDILKAQQGELSNKLKAQNTLIDMNKQGIQRINEEINKQLTKQNELKEKVDNANKAFKDSVQAKGKDNEETKKLKDTLDKLKEEYAKNERAVESSNRKLDNAKIKLNEAEKTILQTNKALEETNKKLGGVKWDKASKDLEKFGNKTKDLGENLTTKVTLPILGAGAGAVKFASDMEENINKTDTVFKQNADNVKKWSETTLEKFGIANVTALDMAATYGDMGSSMGVPIDEATKMSTSLVGLAGDLSSFKNIKIDVAKTALNGIYSGETESLKQLGVVMTQAALQEYAQSKGINKKIQDMSEAEKVTLRYNFVMEKLKNAQGDFEKTNGGVANQSRVTTESIKQLGAEFGQNLLPMVGSVLKPLNEFLKSLTKMTPQQQKIVIGIGAVMAIIPPLLIVIGKISLGISALTGLIGGAGGLGAVLTALTGPVGITVAAIVGLIAIIAALYKNNEDFRNNVNIVWEQIKQIISSVIENIKVIISVFVQVAKELWQKYGDDIVNVAKTAFNLIADIIKLSMNIIKDVIQIVTGIISGDWSKVWQGIKNLISDVWNGIGSIIKNAIDLIKNVIKTGLEIAWDIVKRVFNGIKEAIMTPITAAVDFVGNQVDKIKNFFSNIKIELPHIKMPHFKLDGEFSLSKMTVPSIGVDWYDKGGIFSSPQIIGVGEKRPEFVGALEDLRYLIRDELEKAAVGSNESGGDIIIEKMEVRNDFDIKLIARELYNLQNSRQRALGVR